MTEDRGCLECQCGVAGQYKIQLYRSNPWDEAFQGWLAIWRQVKGGVQSWKATELDALVPSNTRDRREEPAQRVIRQGNRFVRESAGSRNS